MATVTPGKVFVDGEAVTIAKLNQLGNPTVAIGDGEITSDQLSTTLQNILASSSGHNAIINPMFDISTRSNDANAGTVGSTGHAYCVDRWVMNGPSLWSRVLFPTGQTEVPDFPKYMLHWDTDGIAAEAEPGTYAAPPHLGQRINDVRTFAGQTVTWAIYVRSSVSMTVGMQLTQFFGIGGSANVNTAVQNHAITGGDWTKLTYTVALPSIAGKTLTTPDTNPTWLEARCIMPETLPFEIDFAHAQLQLGTSADIFELRSTVTEASLCNVFFERTQAVFSSSVSTIYPCFYFNTPKRNLPTFTIESITAGTGASVLALSINGFYQHTANSAIGIGVVLADAELVY